LAGTTAPFVLFLWKYLSINGKRLLQHCFAEETRDYRRAKLRQQSSRFGRILPPLGRRKREKNVNEKQLPSPVTRF
jgi:hypothetical protein